jgi:hypothetical protein
MTPSLPHRRIWRWKPAAAAVAQLLASAAVTAAFGPKWGLGAAFAAVLIQSQLRPVARKEPAPPPHDPSTFAGNQTATRTPTAFAPPYPPPDTAP